MSAKSKRKFVCMKVKLEASLLKKKQLKNLQLSMVMAKSQLESGPDNTENYSSDYC